jgi:fission process protein 1
LRFLSNVKFRIDSLLETIASYFTVATMGWWSKSEDPPQEPPKVTTEDAKKAFDPDKLPNREKLPKGLQTIVDKAHDDESFFDKVVDG